MNHNRFSDYLTFSSNVVITVSIQDKQMCKIHNIIASAFAVNKRHPTEMPGRTQMVDVDDVVTCRGLLTASQFIPADWP